MSVTCGFYNSNNDRKYNAVQIASIFDGVIRDGVYQSIGEAFIASAGNGMTITIGTGRAWFNHTWTLNDAKLPITIPEAEAVLDKIVYVVLEINSTDAVRKNDFKIVSGTPSSIPKPPELTKTGGVFQYPICSVYVRAGAKSIVQQDITNLVGSELCPFSAGVLQSLTIDDLTKQWTSEFDALFRRLEKAIEDAGAHQLVDGSVTNSKLGKSAVYGDKLKIPEGSILGGVAANVRTSSDTIPVNVDSNGYLWVRAVSVEKLWENASPSSSFPVQGITISGIDTYSTIWVECRSYASQNYIVSSGPVTPISDSRFVVSVYQNYPESSEKDGFERIFTIEKNVIRFQNGLNSVNLGNFIVNDKAMVPVRIYGLK